MSTIKVFVIITFSFLHCDAILYPKNSPTRLVLSLDGLWNFELLMDPFVNDKLQHHYNKYELILLLCRVLLHISCLYLLATMTSLKTQPFRMLLERLHITGGSGSIMMSWRASLQDGLLEWEVQTIILSW